MPKYNSVFTIAFEALHEKQDASDLTYSDLRNALQERLDRLDNTNLEFLDKEIFFRTHTHQLTHPIENGPHNPRHCN